MKAFGKERIGRAQGAISSGEVFKTPSSPQAEAALRSLVEQLRPLLMGEVQQRIILEIENQYDVQEGDFIQFVYNYITNIFRAGDIYNIGQIYTGGDGINIDTRVISVDYGEGLDILSDQVVAKPNTAKAMEMDGSGFGVIVSSTVDAGGAGLGGGITIETTDGLRVAPEDFLITDVADLP